VEKLNIEGKRSGKGFVAHKALLVKALMMAIASRVVLMDITVGLKGLLGYIKALGGSNIVKIVPSEVGASGKQAKKHRVIKVICGNNTSYLSDGDWIGDKTPMTLCEVRVSPQNTVKPNIGASELAEAINRVLPFTATDDNRPVLQCVYFVADKKYLRLVSADGFRLAVARLDYDDGEGKALINRDDLKGVASALRRAKRARVSFEKIGKSLDGMSLIIDTELIRYKWASANGEYPDYEKLTPTEFNITAHFDTVEATKAVNSLKALSDSKSYPIDLNIGDGKIVMSNPDDKGQAELPADTEGEGKIRVEGRYLASVIKACGGMVDLRVNTPVTPMLFSQNGYSVVVMPMMTEEAKKQAAAEAVTEAAAAKTEKPKGKGKGKGKATAEKPPEPSPEPEPEKEPVKA